MIGFMRGQVRALLLLYRDVKPAIRERRRARRDDVISHLIEEGYRDMEILSECLTYGAAGMITTREFITMAGWHLLEQPTLRQRFLDTDEAGRIAILEEILRLEPVVGLLHRTLGDEGDIVGIDVRAANADEEAFGGCPHQIDPDRQLGDRVGRAGMAFGDGEHRCPGAQVALLESAIFLDQLLRVPGLRMSTEPKMGWNALIAGYELRGLRLECGGE
ncbi:cytochrome P450 [Sphingomonas sp. CCH5-D11]|uniref:cytochrome P450 n=1 Tax=Sphingomonas sp. CCH5-D11 TaxID=1768786 RepID=UPI001E550869|nr:cytochrome P450 [Sphingomonas sp. CCH5-D11]